MACPLQCIICTPLMARIIIPCLETTRLPDGVRAPLPCCPLPSERDAFFIHPFLRPHWPQPFVNLLSYARSLSVPLPGAL